VSRLWEEFLSSPAPAGHAAEVYSDVDELAESVAAFLAAGFVVGEPALVVATPTHLTAFSGALAAIGWDDEAIGARATLVAADAETTLAAILEDGRPSRRRFEEVVGSLVDEVVELGTIDGARVFGEMVDLLSSRGAAAAANELEGLWNELRATRRISLLCGYQLDVFDASTQTGTLTAVCSTHSHVLPAHDEDRFATAVDRALVDVLGASRARDVYYIVGGRAREQRVPVAQDALRWVAENLPVQAERVLASARGRYAAAGV
jgi:DcmR-like sensory protein